VQLTDRSIIGFREGAGTGQIFRARNPVTGESLAPDFFSASLDEVNQAARLAHEAFGGYVGSPAVREGNSSVRSRPISKPLLKT